MSSVIYTVEINTDQKETKIFVHVTDAYRHHSQSPKQKSDDGITILCIL
jgi:hypothetical protein